MEQERLPHTTETAGPMLGENHDLLRKLEEASDLVEARFALEAAMGLDLRWVVEFDERVDERAPIDQYKAMKSIRQLAGTFCMFSVHGAAEFGEWLDSSNYNLDHQKPLYFLFQGFNEAGFDRRKLEDVVDAGTGFFGAPGGNREVVARVLSH
jgi:hypothetical protein